MSGPLGLDDDALAACVQCGLCLPHCPTWRVTGEEARSPRGRIEVMRGVQWRGEPVDDGFVESIDSCVACRGCEPACPSAVPFGLLLEGTRHALAGGPAPGRQPLWRRLGYRALGVHWLVLLATRVLAVAQRLRLTPRSVTVPRMPIRSPRLGVTRVGTSGRTGPVGRVWLVTGCVMDAAQRDVHRAAAAVLEAVGCAVAIPTRHEGCCGALALHAGLTDMARTQASRLMGAFPGDAPIVVDSAGCGAQLKDLGRLLGTPEAELFAARVRDFAEFLGPLVHLLPPPAGRPRPTVAVQDPCHLRHVQRSHGAVREVLAPFADAVELDDEGLCCGAGGAYSLLRPDEAAAIRELKVEAIRRSGATVVVSANPGCHLHLGAVGPAHGFTVRHPAQVIAAEAGLSPGLERGRA